MGARNTQAARARRRATRARAFKLAEDHVPTSSDDLPAQPLQAHERGAPHGVLNALIGGGVARACHRRRHYAAEEGARKEAVPPALTSCHVADGGVTRGGRRAQCPVHRARRHKLRFAARTRSLR